MALPAFLSVHKAHGWVWSRRGVHGDCGRRKDGRERRREGAADVSEAVYQILAKDA